MRKATIVISALIIAGSLIQPVAAKSIGYRFAAYRDHESPEMNNYLSARYDHLLQVSPHFRAYRMWKECHTIDIPPLHDDCIASFDQYEPVLPAY